MPDFNVSRFVFPHCLFKTSSVVADKTPRSIKICNVVYLKINSIKVMAFFIVLDLVDVLQKALTSENSIYHRRIPPNEKHQLKRRRNKHQSGVCYHFAVREKQ